MENRSQGFTLTELLITLAVAAILVAIAIPSFQTFRQNNRLTAVANDFLGAVQTARSEAIKRQLPVSVCPSNNPNDVAPTCSAGAFRGWIAFVDINSDCDRTNVALPDGTNETNTANLIRTGGPIEAAVVSASSGDCVSFASTGFRQDVAGHTTAGLTFFWDTDLPSPRCGAQPEVPTDSRAREIEVTNTGRSRVTRVLAEVTAGLADADIECP